MRIAEHGVGALIRYMAGEGYLVDIMRSEGEGWTEIFGQPGGFSHALFHEGPSTGVTPVFHEAGMRFGDAEMVVGYGTKSPVHFFFEFRGVAFETIQDHFVERLDDIFYCRPEIYTRPHASMRIREEAPIESSSTQKKSDRTDGRIGVRIEDL